jgi:hypothetical protein
MKEKIDTIMINSKCLYEWTNEDFTSYIKFTKEKKELITNKKEELKIEILNKRLQDIKNSIQLFYKRKKDEIRYNILKNISNCNSKFTALSLKFGDTFKDYPVIFLLKGPKNDEDYLSKYNIKNFLEILKQDFYMFDFHVISNRNTMTYEVIASNLIQLD